MTGMQASPSRRESQEVVLRNLNPEPMPESSPHGKHEDTRDIKISRQNYGYLRVRSSAF
jgi:hypothetical protein